MSTLGNTGATGTTGLSAGDLIVSRYLASQSGVISSLTAYLSLPNASYARYFIVIYTDSGGLPGTPLDWSADAFDSPSPGSGVAITKAATQGASIVSGNYYHIGFWIQHDSSGGGESVAGPTEYRDIYNVTFSGAPSVPPSSVGSQLQHRQFELAGAYVTFSVPATSGAPEVPFNRLIRFLLNFKIFGESLNAYVLRKFSTRNNRNGRARPFRVHSGSEQSYRIGCAAH